MVIDCHTHLGRNDHINAKVDELLLSMDKAKIDKALVFAGELNDYPTYEMLKEIEPHRDRLYGVASWNFDFTWDDCEKYGSWALGTPQATIFGKLYKAGLITAVKFYTGYYHHMPGGEKITRALEELERFGCPVIFHCGDCLNSVKCAKLKYAHPLNIDEIAVDYPGINFVIAHMGFPWHRDAAEVCYKNSNVYSDFSGFVYKDFSPQDVIKFNKTLEEFLEIAPSDKLLLGTDWPISNQDSYMDTLYSLNMDPESLSLNVKKAFKLP